jgi:glycosyltransferase involved in cell wall biosynthesis
LAADSIPSEAPELLSHEGVTLHRMSVPQMMEPRILARLVRDTRAEAVVGATLLGSFALARTSCGLPFWADQFGHSMAEAQAKAALLGDNRPIAETWNLVRRVGCSADKVSVVSGAQRFAMMGELGALGRLNDQNCGYELIEVIPCAVEQRSGVDASSAERPVEFPRDDFYVLWSGSYNVWSDVETLVAALEGAMSADSRIRFVSTGGEVPGHDESTYHRLEQRVADSPFRDRFLLAGWVEPDEMRVYRDQADLAIVTETPIYEGILGSKNRILEWLSLEIPVLCTELGELSSYLSAGRLALTVRPADVRATTEAILWAANHRSQLQEMSQRARNAAEADFSVAVTTGPLREWADSPQRAPDSAVLQSRGDPMAYASWLDRFAVQAQRFRLVEGSTLARKLWRRSRSWLDS